MRNLLKKYKQLCTYVFWGIGTTVVNLIVYFICTELFFMNHIHSNVIAWILAVIYAYISNKIFVFASKSWHPSVLFKEFFEFVSARFLSGVVETIILYTFVDCLHYPDGYVKIFAGLLIGTVNYLLSKLLIFKK